ncbi:peptidylprolyl isomerase [Tepidibacillus fermentans]|uniref:Peptidyl-prolyl cis-trans isomerase n=1 Tax=Tepidibacillus fermentans TaxID=1281767 RepID=A0A4R3K6C6_9BACI|nr:peptidylprolyl isomerase [Tepidibacillus fermentans]TCS78359.1 peptidylprolyl isomerase [Tepidibacillus fermentans]
MKQYRNPPEMQIDVSKEYIAIIHTNKGDIQIKLFAEGAPKTVNNFVFLAKDGYYNGVKFHRIIKSFMIQTGDPLGNGMGGPGYQFEDELPPVKEYKPGIVAMANAGPNTNGSQFFICSGQDSTYLNRTPNYTVFGEVVEGMDVVDAIASVPVGPSFGGEMSSPKEAVFMKTIDIVEK